MEIERERRNFRIVPKGGGFQKNDVVKSSLDPVRARDNISMWQQRTRVLMHEREVEIGLGLEHLTPAAEEIKRKGVNYVQ
jgi:hypothetical protein